MNVAHIVNGFTKNRLYENLFHHLDEIKIRQQIYSPVRTSEDENYILTKNYANSSFYISNILKLSHRILFRKKVKTIFKDFLKKCSIDDLNLIHAHTLYSDGAVAFQLKQEFEVPYIVAVRSTDLIIFEKYRPDLKLYRNRILEEAEKVIFLSPTIKYNFVDSLSSDVRKKIEPKSKVIPNGIDSIYFSNDLNNKKNESSDILKVLYVGNFRRLKNLPVLIKAVKKVNKTKKATLTIVGGHGADEDLIKSMINSGNYSFIDYLGTIEDPVKLKSIYSKSSIFAMISKPETFGLVYIEALSQGTPIIYTRGEGVDGYFKKNAIGERVTNVQDYNEVAYKIIELSERLSTELSKDCVKVSKRFNWSRITNTYWNIYSDIIFS